MLYFASMDPAGSPNRDISKAAGIIIRDRKLLVEKDFDKDFFVAPGGKLDPGETPRQALVRELKEEFAITVRESDLEDFGVFHAPASGQEHRTVHMTVFMVKKYTGEIAHGHKVEKLLWLTSQLPPDTKIGSIFAHEVLPHLKKLNLVD